MTGPQSRTEPIDPGAPSPASAAERANAAGVGATEQGRLDEAAACFERAIRLDPRCAEAHYNLGNVLVALSRSAEARALESSTVLQVGYGPVRDLYREQPEKLWSVVRMRSCSTSSHREPWQ